MNRRARGEIPWVEIAKSTSIELMFLAAYCQTSSHKAGGRVRIVINMNYKKHLTSLQLNRPAWSAGIEILTNTVRLKENWE